MFVFYKGQNPLQARKLFFLRGCVALRCDRRGVEDFHAGSIVYAAMTIMQGTIHLLVTTCEAVERSCIKKVDIG